MRLIHTADLHLDSRLETNLDPIKAKERKRELLLSFENLVNYAKKNEINAILISGDFFDKPKASVKTRDYVLGIIQGAPEIDFFMIYGNHDDNSLQDDAGIRPENLHMFGTSFETVAYKGVDITGISLENISPALYDTLVLNKTHRNIVMLHGDINQSSSIPVQCLKDKGIDYLALGHIHKYKRGRLDDRGVWVYPGCLEGRGFDEEGPKGFVQLEIAPNKFDCRFIPFATRTLHDIQVDISACENWTDIKKAVNQKLNEIPVTDMIRIRLTGEFDLDLIKQDDILEQSLNQQYYFAKVSDETKLRINPKDYENDISLKGEFIRKVLASNMPEDDKNKIIEYGIKALMKEEI